MMSQTVQVASAIIEIRVSNDDPQQNVSPSHWDRGSLQLLSEIWCHDVSDYFHALSFTRSS